MKILDRIEDVVESFLAGLFRKNNEEPIQPVEIGKKLIKAMESRKRVSIAKTYVPNKYQVFLHPDQIKEILYLQNTLTQELKGVLYQKAEKEQLSFIGNLAIDFDQDPKLKPYVISVQASFLENNDTSESDNSKEITTRTQVFATNELQSSVIIEDVAGKQEIKLLPKRYSIGRSIKCDIVIHDHNVSRIHAWLDYSNNQWYLKDNESTNGTYVNDEPIREHELTTNDQIRVGTTRLKYKEERR